MVDTVIPFPARAARDDDLRIDDVIAALPIGACVPALVLMAKKVERCFDHPGARDDLIKAIEGTRLLCVRLERLI